jgi:TolB-like protein
MPQADQQLAHTPPRERPGWMAIAFILVFVLAGVALYLTGVRLVRRPSAPSTIAVLPFASPGSDPETERFSNDLTAQLTSALAKVGSLHVADRAAALEFKGKTGKVQDAGRRLGAEVLVEGTVDRSGNRLRVVARLVRTVNPYQLWSHTYEIDAQNAAGFENELTRAIAGAVQTELRVGGRGSVRK